MGKEVLCLVSVGTFVRIPIGTDVYTLQFLFTLLAGLVLGARLGALSVGTYVLLGLIGLPVFATGGGFSYVLRPTFGYLLGFVIQAYICGDAAARLRQVTFRRLFLINLGGMALVYLIGISWFYVASNYVVGTQLSAWAAIFYCGILQAPPDIVLCLVAAKLALRLYQAGLWLNKK